MTVFIKKNIQKMSRIFEPAPDLLEKNINIEVLAFDYRYAAKKLQLCQWISFSDINGWKNFKKDVNNFFDL